jgi:hypothetical protein
MWQNEIEKPIRGSQNRSERGGRERIRDTADSQESVGNCKRRMREMFILSRADQQVRVHEVRGATLQPEPKLRHWTRCAAACDSVARNKTLMHSKPATPPFQPKHMLRHGRGAFRLRFRPKEAWDHISQQGSGNVGGHGHGSVGIHGGRDCKHTVREMSILSRADQQVRAHKVRGDLPA